LGTHIVLACVCFGDKMGWEGSITIFRDGTVPFDVWRGTESKHVSFFISCSPFSHFIDYPWRDINNHGWARPHAVPVCAARQACRWARPCTLSCRPLARCAVVELTRATPCIWPCRPLLREAMVRHLVRTALSTHSLHTCRNKQNQTSTCNTQDKEQWTHTPPPASWHHRKELFSRAPYRHRARMMQGCLQEQDGSCHLSGDGLVHPI
jgi:hypothetical protein